MLPNKLILPEGIPGSGKSTLAQTLHRHPGRADIPVRWCYEEDRAHPVYIFHDQASSGQVQDELAAGPCRAVVARALEQWKRFADVVRTGEEVELLDGCLWWTSLCRAACTHATCSLPSHTTSLPSSPAWTSASTVRCDATGGEDPRGPGPNA